ncbi:hypothetical protein BC629DRAFT_1289220 [Irpex lacteus]|nr:hypothetical protein BC629DRAFT_1289220 [Irpex lacteus]
MTRASCLAFWLASLSPLVACGNVAPGGKCSLDSNRLDPATHKFMTDCDDKTFCASSNSTCQPKGCRRDEFPFGYGAGDALPPLCDRAAFCPDDGSACKDLVGSGQACEMNRDEQCAPMVPRDGNIDDFSVIAICLFSTCMYANATIGQPCVLDHTKYIDVGPDGQQFNNDIIRHNCYAPQLYCDPTALQCFRSKPIGQECSLDIECRSQNCEDGTCQEAIGTPRHVQLWQYVVSIVVVAVSMAATVISLVIVHKRLRLENQRQLREYYHEQISLRRSMFALHHHAANSSLHLEKHHEQYTQ